LKYVLDPQVEVSLVKYQVPKIIIDPQVTVNITKITNPSKIVNPQVSIEVLNWSGQKVFVLGEVNNPGVFLNGKRMKLVEAISRAGGLTLDAREDSIVLVKGKKRKAILINFDLENIEDNSSVQNPVLEKGDIVYIPKIRNNTRGGTAIGTR